MNALDFDKICRLCLESKKQNYNIFTSFHAKMNILYLQMLYTCTEIKPQEGDGFPSIICKECSRHLKRAYSFNLQCVASDNKLLALVETKPAEGSAMKCESDAEDKMDIEVLDDLKESEDFKSDIKCELEFEDDWNAEDDNILLKEVKDKKTEEDSLNITMVAHLVKKKSSRPKLYDDSTNATFETHPVKKKRGRPKLYGINGKLHSTKVCHQCDLCGKVLTTSSNLNAHKRCHSDLRPYTCEVCPATFKAYSALFQHKKIHTGETPYQCDFCARQFARRTALVNHLLAHTGEKLFGCDICSKSFRQKGQLSIHLKRHKGDKPFLCQDCGKGFPLQSDLKVHQRVHNGEKPYNCTLCPKKFATAGNLSIHIRIHNKEIRYHCKECKRGFVTCSAYNVHVKRHLGQRDYKCECGKAFYTSGALKQHRVVHTGEKNYQCKICERKFSQTSHLSRHFKKDHAKPNVPVSSEQYKIVLNRSVRDYNVFNSIENEVKLFSSCDDVKCENS